MRRHLDETTLHAMHAAGVEIRARVLGDGGHASAEDVALLATFVDNLVEEIHALVWRSTVATMALDGRVHPEEIRLAAGSVTAEE